MALSDALIIDLIVSILWEDGNPNNEWTPDTVEAIADVIRRYRPHLDPNHGQPNYDAAARAFRLMTEMAADPN